MGQGVTLITDSSACLPQSLIERHDIRIVPILLQIGSREFRDGVDLRPEAVYRALEDGVPVKSSAPSPLDYLEAIEAAEGSSVLVVTPATEFTRMHRHASLAAELAGRDVRVVDSRSATAGHGLVVLSAAEALASGAPVEEAVAAAARAAARTELVACLDSLEFLRQSGRVPALAVGLANHLGVRPCFRMRDGTAERLGLPRSEEAALQRIARQWRAGGGRTARRSAVFHAARPDRAERLAAMLGGVSFVTEFSAAMGIHTGPGVVGVAWVASDQELPVP